jgi:hypothetical protein
MLRCSVRRAAGLALLVLLGGAAGCGKQATTVTGKVTYKGRALTSGDVLFLSDNDTLTRAPIGPDGTYTARGVPVGPAKLGVDNPPPPRDPAATSGLPPAKDSSNDPEVKELKERAAHYVATPKHYRDPKQSGLTYTVQTGSQTHNIDLQ